MPMIYFLYLCTELVGHKIARLNRKSFFYSNHHPLVHFPQRPISTKGNFALLSIVSYSDFKCQSKKDNTNAILKESHPV